MRNMEYNISKNMEERLSSVEMWFYRRMLSVSWMDKLSNQTMLEKAETHKTLVTTITKRQMSFLVMYVEMRN